MTDDNKFLTTTMARLYAEQGYVEKAAEIYRSLLKIHPGREDLKMALTEIEKTNVQKDEKTDSELISLFKEWIDLLIRLKRIEKMNKLKNYLSE